MGIAVVDTLERAGVEGVALKWPNDVLLDGRKLCGVLVDVVAAPRGVRVVVGVGVNLELPEAARAEIDQPATDLASVGVTVSRNALVAGLLCSLVDFAKGFEEFGFEPMVGTYDAHHFYQGRSCRIVQGDRSTSGIVRGVTAGGELVLDTSTGTHAYGAGEVSLRS
jgi:BirA family biotin operon repressor/biotin-[acetyl-CoA-carboxylase] ligase